MSTNGDSVSGNTGHDTINERLGALAEMVQSAANATAQLWRDVGLNGDLTAQLVEVSHSLHRAAVALSDVHLIGHDSHQRP